MSQERDITFLSEVMWGLESSELEFWVLVLIPALSLIGSVTLGALPQLSVLSLLKRQEAPALGSQLSRCCYE